MSGAKLEARFRKHAVSVSKVGIAYPRAIPPWVEKWKMLSSFFDYPSAVHKVTYTTNTVEGCHRQLRKVTKRGFSSDIVLQNLVYLTTQNVQIKWETTTYNWKEVINQFSTIFEKQIKSYCFE